MMSLQALLEKSADTDLLREMIGFAAHRLMELRAGSRRQGGPPRELRARPQIIESSFDRVICWVYNHV
jgi:hypothetical protein